MRQAMKKGLYKDVVLYTRFPKTKLEIKRAFQYLAKKKNMDANKLTVKLIEEYVKKENEREENMSEM